MTQPARHWVKTARHAVINLGKALAAYYNDGDAQAFLNRLDDVERMIRATRNLCARDLEAERARRAHNGGE